MSTVGVRELKEHLSEYLEQASRGEQILVTDRGRPKAMIGPLPGRAHIEDGIAEGWISAGSGAALPARAVLPAAELRDPGAHAGGRRAAHAPDHGGAGADG